MKETGLRCEQATRGSGVHPQQRHFACALFSASDDERSCLDRTRTVPALRHTTQLFLKTPNIDQTFCSLSVEVAMPHEPCPLPTVKAPTHKRAAEIRSTVLKGSLPRDCSTTRSVMRQGQFQLVQWLR